MVYFPKISNFTQTSCDVILSSVYMMRKGEVNDTCTVTTYAGLLHRVPYKSNVISRTFDN